MNNKKMNILFSASSTFVRQALVLMASIYENHKDKEVDIYMIHSELNEEEVSMVVDFAKKNNQKAYSIKIEEETFKGFKTTKWFTAEAYYRLIVHNLVSKDIDRMLYLDVDIVVDKDIYDFYCMDFEDNYIITCLNFIETEKWNYEIKHNFDSKLAKNGRYINSGVILFNYNKFRESNINLEKYKEVCEELDNDYFFDQGLISYMFGKTAKYVSTLDYNHRYANYYGKEKEILEMKPKKAIIHYNNYLTPCKPWDLTFTEEELNDFNRGKPINTIFDNFIINKTLNDLHMIWWKYAKMTPVYDVLKIEADAKKEWYIRKLNSYTNKAYDCALKYDNLQKEHKNLLEKKDDEIIQKIQLSNDTNFLGALGIVYNEHFKTYKKLKEINKLNEYFDFISKIEERVIIILSVNDEASMQWAEFNATKPFGMKKSLLKKFRHSYIGVFNKYENFVYEELNNKKIVYKKDFIDGDIALNVESEGYNVNTNSKTSKIEVNFFNGKTINLSINKRGLNVAILDSLTGYPMDSFNVDMHVDKELKINRFK